MLTKPNTVRIILTYLSDELEKPSVQIVRKFGGAIHQTLRTIEEVGLIESVGSTNNKVIKITEEGKKWLETHQPPR